MGTASGQDEATNVPCAGQPAVSVLIPVFDYREGLPECVASLLDQDLPLDQLEVIVIDNGPENGVAERLPAIEKVLIGFPNYRVLRESRRGSYAARNLGLSVASADVVAFTDADCLPRAGWARAGLSYLREHPEVDAVAGVIEVFPRNPHHRTGAELYELRHGFQQQKYVEAGGFGATANLFVRRSAFEHVGEFDASLHSCGDRDWGNRLHSNGRRMGFEAAAAVRHPARHDLGELRKKINRVVAGDLVLRSRSGWSRLNWLRYSMQPLRPPLRTIWRARTDPEFKSMWEVCRYGATFITVRWITAECRMRRLSRWPRPARGAQCRATP